MSGIIFSLLTDVHGLHHCFVIHVIIKYIELLYISLIPIAIYKNLLLPNHFCLTYAFTISTSASMAYRYPLSPSPTTCPLHTGTVTDV